jgi:hypothetical protein
MKKSSSGKKSPKVPIEGYNPEYSGVPGTGETMADMFLSIARKDPKLRKRIKDGEITIHVVNS